MIGVIIQARMGSSRLPGKVLKNINNIPSIEFQINRIKKAKKVDKIILATSTEAFDDPIEELCKEKDILFYRGPEQDVLKRYFDCAKLYNLSTVVRLTGDCPLVDPKIIDLALDSFFKYEVDYCSNTVPPETSKWPDGSDIEVFSFDSLQQANDEAIDFEDREHVTFFFWKKNQNRFKTYQLPNEKDWSNFRYTVDYPEDYEVIKLIAEEFFRREDRDFTIKDIINFLTSRPDIVALNSKFHFGQGWSQQVKQKV